MSTNQKLYEPPALSNATPCPEMGDYSCVCGFAMKEPCEHWKAFLANQAAAAPSVAEGPKLFNRLDLGKPDMQSDWGMTDRKKCHHNSLSADLEKPIGPTNPITCMDCGATWIGA